MNVPDPTRDESVALGPVQLPEILEYKREAEREPKSEFSSKFT